MLPSATYHRRFIHLHFYSIINFGSNHCGSYLHLNIMNDVSSAILDMDTVSSFTCLFDGFISSDFRIVIIIIILCSIVRDTPTSALG